MSWNTLQAKVQSMGYELAFRNKRNDAGGYIPDLTPPSGPGWIYVSNYDNVASFWIKPLTDGSRKLSSSLVYKIVAELDQFIGTVGDSDVDCFGANASILLPLQQSERSGRRRILANERRRAPNHDRRYAPRIELPDQPLPAEVPT